MIADGCTASRCAAAAKAFGKCEISGAAGSISAEISSPGQVKSGSTIGSGTDSSPAGSVSGSVPGFDGSGGTIGEESATTGAGCIGTSPDDHAMPGAAGANTGGTTDATDWALTGETADR